jgi:D-glycero-alpha-D-manno-heptose-7-phosphate kinase
LNEPIGLQDQYITALGGIKQFNVTTSGELSFENIPLSLDKIDNLQKSLVLIYTGVKRDSKSILFDQVSSTYNKDSNVIERLNFVKSQVPLIREALIDTNIDLLGKLFHQHWSLKIKQSKEMSSELINNLYSRTLDHGAIGGKLIGAGGGGFLLVVVRDKDKFLEKASMDNLEVVPFEFEMNGTTTLFNY